jgi:hypothetical protein
MTAALTAPIGSTNRATARTKPPANCPAARCEREKNAGIPTVRVETSVRWRGRNG